MFLYLTFGDTIWMENHISIIGISITLLVNMSWRSIENYVLITRDFSYLTNEFDE